MENLRYTLFQNVSPEILRRVLRAIVTNRRLMNSSQAADPLKPEVHILVVAAYASRNMELPQHLPSKQSEICALASVLGVPPRQFLLCWNEWSRMKRRQREEFIDEASRELRLNKISFRHKENSRKRKHRPYFARRRNRSMAFRTAH